MAGAATAGLAAGAAAPGRAATRLAAQRAPSLAAGALAIAAGLAVGGVASASVASLICAASHELWADKLKPYVALLVIVALTGAGASVAGPAGLARAVDPASSLRRQRRGCALGVDSAFPVELKTSGRAWS